MRETIYYQRNAPDPILDQATVLEIVHQYVPEAKMVTSIDESGGEARAYVVDDNIILKVQRPQQLRSSTSLEKEVFFLNQIAKQTDASVPRVLGYGKKDKIEYILMTKMEGIPVEKTKLSKKEKNDLLLKLGTELRKIHNMDMHPFLESGLFPHDEPRGDSGTAGKKINVVALENGVFTLFSGVYLFYDGELSDRFWLCFKGI